MLSALTSTSGAPAGHLKRLSPTTKNQKSKNILSHYPNFFTIFLLLKRCLHPPCPDRSRWRLCVSLPSNISSVYLPWLFSVGFKISIQTLFTVLPVFVRTSWSIFLSLQCKRMSKCWNNEPFFKLLLNANIFIMKTAILTSSSRWRQKIYFRNPKSPEQTSSPMDLR